MNRIIYICLLVLLALPTFSLAAAIGPARVSYVAGDILFQTPDSDEWLPVALNTPLDEGDAVWCPVGSRVEIQLPDGSVVRLDDGSQLDMIANEDGFIHLHLASGHLYLRTSQTARDNALQIDADDTTVVPSARTRLRVDMLPNSLEDVAITKGSAYVEGNGSRTRVRAGEHILLEEGYNEILPLNPADSWEVWNVDRDRSQSRSAKADSHLPDELRGYSAEMDASGSWVNVPEYGMVWRPAVVVSDDWAPYRSGRWIWRGDDYIWLSFESWGWVPYHYGRWAVVSGIGWCWVPPVRGDVFWSPGYVGWYSTGSHVGWTPLAPGEIYYGRKNYGRHSVIATNITINTNSVTYRNRNYRGGLTVLQQNDFLSGRAETHLPSGRPSVSVSVSIGSPRIQPIRETRMPLIKQTPPRAAPPQIERRDHHELRDRFPRVAPVPANERQRQQPATISPAPTTPSGRPQLNEKKTTFPVVIPVDRKPGRERPQPQATPRQQDDRPQPSTQPPVTQTAPPASRPDQPVRQQREERRQGERPAQATTQPATPVTQSQPPVSATVPQRAEQPRRETVPPADRQARPAATPSRQGTPAAPATPPSASAPQRAEKATHPEKQPRKVWNVTTPEGAGASEKGNQGGEGGRGRDRRER